MLRYNWPILFMLDCSFFVVFFFPFFFLNKSWCYYFIVYQFFTSLLSIKSEKLFQSHRSSLRMQTARYPCRQLNSKTIKSAALCYLSLVFLGKCSIISAKCVCKVEEEGFENAWNGVCRTRDACDRALRGWFVVISNIFLHSLSDWEIIEMVHWVFLVLSCRYEECRLLFQCY